MEFRDYYAVLDVARSATDKEVRRAYRRLAREHHPDVNPDDESAAQRFRDIAEAYEVLGDKEKRALYDRYGKDWTDAQRAAEQGVDFDAWRAAQRAPSAGPGRGPAAAGGPSSRAGYTYATAEEMEEMFGEAGYSDFFESLFGQGGAPRSARAAGPRAGSDVEAPVQVSLEEAFHGARRMLEREGGPVELHIPAGVRDGTRVRIRGQGQPGRGGGNPGDLYLRIQLDQHARFVRSGDDLEVSVSVPLFTALLGGEVPVETLDGTVVLRIPEGTAPQSRIRLKSRGMPRAKNKGRGDMFVRVQIELPTELDDDERALVEQWREMRAAREVNA